MVNFRSSSSNPELGTVIAPTKIKRQPPPCSGHALRSIDAALFDRVC